MTQEKILDLGKKHKQDHFSRVGCYRLYKPLTRTNFKDTTIYYPLDQCQKVTKNLLGKADSHRAVSNKVLDEVGKLVNEHPEVLPCVLQHPLHAGPGVQPYQTLNLLPHPVVDKLVQRPLHPCVHHLERCHDHCPSPNILLSSPQPSLPGWQRCPLK